jgi:hypothetical protein
LHYFRFVGRYITFIDIICIAEPGPLLSASQASKQISCPENSNKVPNNFIVLQGVGMSFLATSYFAANRVAALATKRMSLLTPETASTRVWPHHPRPIIAALIIVLAHLLAAHYGFTSRDPVACIAGVTSISLKPVFSRFNR